MFPFDLRYRRFIGIIIDDDTKKVEDTKLSKTTGGQSRYKVHIPELMPFIEEGEGIWCYNTHKGTKNIITGRGIETTFGDYTSLVDGTEHFIIFVENDVNSCRILEPTGN
jgi:hypothetical protein